MRRLIQRVVSLGRHAARYGYYAWHRRRSPDIFDAPLTDQITVADCVRGFGYTRAIVNWFLDKGETLRLQYPLAKESVVFDIGGYIGDWAQAIHDRFHSSICIFEPNPQSIEAINRRFTDHPNVRVFPFGLSEK